MDLLTVVAIGIVSFIFKNVVHEGLGHGGACLMVGGIPQMLSTAHFDCGYQSVTEMGVRFVAFGGALANFFMGYLLWLAFGSPQIKAPTLRYFIWFAMSGNFFVAAGYPLFSGIIGAGDFIDVVQGWGLMWVWRLILIAIGLGLYAWAIWVSLRELPSLIGSNPGERLARAFKLTIYPYLVGASAASLGALLNPLGPFVLFTSAAASFGGSSAFAWMSQMLKTRWFPQVSDSQVEITRNWVWIALAAILLLLHILVLGPGLKLT